MIDTSQKVNPTRLIVLDKTEVEEKTASGILLPNQVKKKSSMSGVVQLVGSGTDQLPMCWKIGETVIFRANAGQTFDHDGVEYRILDINDVLLGG